MTDTSPLQTLLTTFRVQNLGDGDLNQGINTLTAMAISLANLAPDAGLVFDAKGRTTRLGANLLVTGSASSGAISDEVTTEIGLRQKNLHLALQRFQEWLNEEKSKPLSSPPPQGKVAFGAENVLAEIFQGLGPLGGTENEQWGTILTADSTECFPDFVKSSNFFIAASKPQNLAHEVTALRPGHPVIHLGLSHPSDFASYAEAGAAILEGRFTSKEGESVKGNIFMTDPLELLRDLAQSPDERTAWMKQFLWLCDGNTGPEVSPPRSATEDSDSIRKRYGIALTRILAQRLNRRRQSPMSFSLDTRASVIRFRRFLDKMEPKLPGITGACRNLINSLVFGLGEMARIEKQFPVSSEAAEELAMLLVRRMANVRSTMIHEGALKQRQDHIRRIFNKLARGEYNTRTIYKDLSIPADECRACLAWLEGSELINESSGKWCLADNAELSFSNSLSPLLEV